jgi:hypothetical protein
MAPTVQNTAAMIANSASLIAQLRAYLRRWVAPALAGPVS